MTPQDDSREIAFWLDAALLTLADYDAAERAGDIPALREKFRTLVAVSAQYEEWGDPRAAETLAQINARLRQQFADLAALRRAYQVSPHSPLWESGEYGRLTQSGPAGG